MTFRESKREGIPLNGYEHHFMKIIWDSIKTDELNQNFKVKQN